MKKPTHTTDLSTRVEHKGRVVHGLNAKTMTDEQLSVAVNFLYAAIDGQGSVSQDIPFIIDIADIHDQWFLTAHPKEIMIGNDAASVGLGRFLGMLEMAGGNHVAFGSTNVGVGQVLSFDSKSSLVSAINKLAAHPTVAQVHRLENSSVSKSAAEWLAEIAPPQYEQGR